MLDGQEIQKRLQIVSEILREATPLIMQGFSVNPGNDVNREDFLQLATKSSVRDLVTRFDKEVEAFIAERIKKSFPGEVILGEEEQSVSKKSIEESIKNLDTFWLIDPIDGTKNYFRAYPFFCSTVCMLKKVDGIWTAVLGITWDPVRQEMFSAGFEQGAFINGNRMKVSNVSNPQVALFSSGFAAARLGFADHAYSSFRKVSENTLGVRRSGTAALDLAYVAAGRIDGYWERGLDEWDTAAGMLILKEAGGSITKFNGQDAGSLSGEIVATNSKLQSWLLEQLT